MHSWFDVLSLRWKLTAVTVIAAAATLIGASLAMGVYDARAYKAQQIGNGTAEAKVLAASVAASLVFNDADATREYLNALVADPEVDAAAVYAADGSRVAQYLRPDTALSRLPERAMPAGYSFIGNDLRIAEPVAENNDTVGTVFIAVRVESVQVRFARYASILLAIGAVVLAIVLPIALWLHRMISNPLEELAARNAIIKATLDSVDHGVIVVDPNRRVTFMNDRAAELFAAVPDLHVGADFPAFVERWHAAIGVSELARITDNEQMETPRNARGLYTLPDGRAVEYRQSVVGPGGFVRTYTDITAEKALQAELEASKEKAEQAATAKSQFLAAMSHEIRTPMNGVIGIVELLRATSLNDEQKQMVEIIRQSGISLLDVINDILDYSKIEAGRMTVETTDCALPEIVESTAAVVGGHTSSKFLDIACAVDPRIDAVVLGDPVRIRQVILNLMGNAIKFTQAGTVAIEARAESVTEAEIVVLFEISDTGIGIPEDKQKQLFQAFAQADYSTTRRFGGTGLGLSICKNLIVLMGGEIGVRSTVGQGSTFWFRVPFARLPAERRSDPFAPMADSLRGLRILVCDSGRGSSIAPAYLRAAGAEVIETADAVSAIAALRAEQAAGHPVAVAVYRMGLTDDHAKQFTAAMQQDKLDTKLVLIVPHLSARSAQLAVQVASVPAPIARAKLIETVAVAAGRAVKPVGAPTEVAPARYIAPAVDEAIAGNALILVAEDNQTNQFVIRSQLDRLGFAAEFVSDGREAWEVLQRYDGRYGMLITDCHMPFIDGYQLTGLIRDRELASGRRLPVVALTANALQGEADICRAAGMDGYMFKPTNLPTLETMVLKWLPQAGPLRRGGSPPPPAPPLTKVVPRTKAPVDLAELARLLGSDDPATLADMLAMFWESESSMPETLRALAGARDGHGLKGAAHGAKGAAASVGALALAELCRALEQSAAMADWAAVERLMPQIDQAFAEVGAFIANARDNLETV